MSMSSQGFTLIELVVVIVILGVISAVALPKLVDLRNDAGTASATAVADAMSSASSINYAAVMARGTGGSKVVRIVSSAAPSSCDAIATVLMSGIQSAQYSITGSVANTCSAGVSMTCGVSSTQAGSSSATATLICTG